MIVISPIFRLIARILSFILFGLTVLAGYSGRMNPDYFTYPVLFVLLLPYLAIATFVVSAAWIVCRRFITGAVGLLCIAVAWGPISNTVPVSFSKSATPGATTFKVLTYNIVHGWDQTQQVEDRARDQQGNKAFDYVIHSGADIVCLQEVRRWKDFEIPNFSSFADTLRSVYPYITGPFDIDTKVLSKYPIELVPSERYIKTEDYDKRSYSFYRVNIKGKMLTLINFHLISIGLDSEECKVVTGVSSVNGAKESLSELKGSIRIKFRESARARKKEVEVLREALSNIEGPVLLCGDMNDVPESFAYRLLRGEDLHDAYVETGFGPLVTFNQHAFWFHLDQIFYRGGLKALSVRKGKVKYSDHYPLMAEFEFAPDAK